MQKRTKKILYIFLILLVLEGIISIGLNHELRIGFNEKGKFIIQNVKAEKSIQEQIREEFQSDKIVKIAGKFPINWNVTKMIFIVDLILILLAFLVKKSLRLIPSKIQIISEMLYSFFRDLVTETVGKDRAYFTPYIFTIFFFIFTCNIVGLIPIPGNMEPTRNLNVPLGMGFMAIIIVHFTSIKAKGIKVYLKDYAEPLFFMAPLNVVGELAKGISISFRLFGNILGGAIIILVISNLTKFILVPIGLNLFFGLFIGTVQAFVFTMLVLSYTAVAIK
ncbi:MAG: F0F1 ATP synthase subunit A [Candidatus Cloacimonetes bacterium]|nr:F0F1 ATP synthase subunit A [Candidatus Cloacimonadota bacterium]MBL7107792.1 F0F1 ATP synthase subunit A [Candidatus Cloacimonadota bacterium]